MKRTSFLELLAPARDKEQGIMAINHGADAVYIGADQFGARDKVGNSVRDIEALAKYAHYYKSQVFVALNTMLFDRELDAAHKLIWQLYEAGVDALIVQDMGVLEMDLPPIGLHASTQTHNFDLDRIQFFDKVGFQRIVLARELTLAEITQVRDTTSIEIEQFIHGALCVALSGQCYLSQDNGGRSANRGSCAQACRLPYQLSTSDGTLIAQNKHVLSMRDLNTATRLGDLARAGVQSFKIEGRLKGPEYVKNTVAFYRQELDGLLTNGIGTKASSGTCTYSFVPELDKSFSRSATTYFLDGRQPDMATFDSPKSIGKSVGKVKRLLPKGFDLEGAEKVSNGDGLCFLDEQGEMQGFRVNVADGQYIKGDIPKGLSIGTTIYRNLDHAFAKELDRSEKCRKISVDLQLAETENGFILVATDEDGFCTQQTLVTDKELAQNSEKAFDTIKRQLSKMGDSNFVCHDVHIDFNQAYFLPAGKLNQLRRDVITALDELRSTGYVMPRFQFEKTEHPYPDAQLDYKANIANELARKFYERHGVTHSERAFELLQNKDDADLMTTRYCVKFEMKRCPKAHRKPGEKPDVGSLFIENEQGKFRLDFDCKKCMMYVRKA